MSEESPQNTTPQTTVSDQVQPTIAPTNIDPLTGRPPGAAEPIIHRPPYPSIPISQNSAHSLLLTGSEETHNIQPVGSTIPVTTPGQIQVSANFRDEQLQTSSSRLRWEVFQYLVQKTAAWVLAGILVMLFGVALTDVVILPRIHTCPPSASCPRSYDPNTGNALQLLQAFMSNWLKAGVMISSIGILKLSSYQAWFILMHQGNTFKNLDLALGAIRGSLNDASFLLFKKNNRLLSAFVFTLLGIGGAISLVIGLSIEREPTILALGFSYNTTVDTPDSLAFIGHLNNDGQLKAIQKVISWSLRGDKSHDGALRGSLVLPDSRNLVASNAIPGGPLINGWFECRGWENYTIQDEGKQNVTYNIIIDIRIRSAEFVAQPDMRLNVAPWAVDTAITQYVWVSNTTGLIPNATTTSDGRMNIALCTHWLDMEPEGLKKGGGVDYLMPSEPQTTGCINGGNSGVCVADSVGKAIFEWWGGPGTAFWPITCRGGVLGPVPPTDEQDKYCTLTQELWKETGVSMLDGIMQTAPRRGISTQTIHAIVEGVSKKRWWVNAIIPAATFVVYLVGLVHTCFLSRGDNVLKELKLHEIVKAAQTDHVRDLVSEGELEKAPVLYRNTLGFIDAHRARPG